MQRKYKPETLERLAKQRAADRQQSRQGSYHNSLRTARRHPLGDSYGDMYAEMADERLATYRADYGCDPDPLPPIYSVLHYASHNAHALREKPDLIYTGHDDARARQELADADPGNGVLLLLCDRKTIATRC